mgnify:CR=1 FL=1
MSIVGLCVNGSGDAVIHPWGVTVNPPTFYFGVIIMALTTPKIFAQKIEEIVKEKQITHMEAVLWYCGEQDIEPDSVKGMISKPLKEKIEANARDLNFLPRQAQLPV